MKKTEGIPKRRQMSIRLLCSYLIIILAPAIAILVIYFTMQKALLDIQKEKAQNLSLEAAVTFSKEVEQIGNVAKYIANDGSLKQYMLDKNSDPSADTYYHAYELAKSYPDYALLNRFIKNIYLLPFESSYLFKIPQVASNTPLGMSIMDISTGMAEYEKLVQSLYDLRKNGLYYGAGDGMPEEFRIVQRFDYTGNDRDTAGVIVIDLQERELKNLLSQCLGADSGIAFLTDQDGRILYVHDTVTRVYNDTSSYATPAPECTDWKEYLSQAGLTNRTVTINRAPTEINGWSIITVLRKQELLSKVGPGKYVILVLCILSILIGVAICLWYWNSNQTVVDQYLKYKEKYPETPLPQQESTNIWKNFGGVFDYVDNLHLTLDKQKDWLRKSIIQKILFGIYDSEEDLARELTEADLPFPIELPCVLAALEAENPMQQEASISADALEETLRKVLDELLPWPYLMLNLSSLNYVLFLSTGDAALEELNLKQTFEKINYAVYSQIPVNIFTGISKKADTALAIAEEYEHVCRICEYARYYKLRIPCMLEELPRHQHVVFTVELEIQLEKTIKSGAREQLTTVMTQVRENYLYVPRGESMPARHNLEVLRCILLRCLGEQPKDTHQEALLTEIQSARLSHEIEDAIWHTWQYFEDQRILCQDKGLEALKNEIEACIEQGYPAAEFNLASLAEQLNLPEKRLYRDFKKMYGVSFTSYLEMKRLRYAQEFLKSRRPVGEVAQAVGYSSDYSFRRAFKRVVGVAPSDYQKMQEQQEQTKITE